MKILKVRSCFSYIGNFADFLISNEQRIKNLMMEYEIQTKVEQLPDGRELKNLLFSKQNISVRFLASRLDFTFNFPNPDVSEQAVFSSALEYFELFSEIFPDILGSRIAIVQQGFILNENQEAIEEFTSKMGFTAAFGNCNELAFKINAPKERFETLNTVLDVQMGEAKHNKSLEKMKVLLINIDVNTLITNSMPRFNPKNFAKDFNDLQEEVTLRHQAIEAF